VTACILPLFVHSPRATTDLYTPSLHDALPIYVNDNDSALHVMGLLSDGGVHSHYEHMFAILKMAKEKGLDHVYVHAFLDGRDVNQESALEYVEEAERGFEIGRAHV